MISQSERLGTEKISTLLYRLSLPAITGLVVNSLYNVVDTIFIGQGVGPMAIGGLAIAFPVQLLSVGFASLVGIGTASAVSRNLGARNVEKANTIAGNGYVFIVALSLLFTTLGLLFTDPLLRLFGATDTLIPYARDYVRIILAGNVFFSFKMTAQHVIQSEGNAKVAMVSTVLGGLLNIALDPLFIFGLQMGIKGAAYATIISQFAAFVYVLSYLWRGKTTVRVLSRHLMPRLAIIREIFAVGSSAFARTATNTIFLIVMNNSLRVYGGDAAITIFGVVNRIAAFLFLPGSGIVQAMQPIAGYNHGAKRMDRVNQVLKLSIIATTAIGFCGLLIGQTLAPYIIRVFTSDPDIVASGAGILRIVIAALPALGIQFVGATLFQALGKPGPAIILSLLRQFILLTPLTIILPRIYGLGLMGLWAAFPVADVLALIITLLLIRREVRLWANIAVSSELSQTA